MKKVYIVTSGAYSDYSIVAVCSTKELAEQLQARIDGHNEVETYTVDADRNTQALEQLEAGYICLMVDMERDGDSQVWPWREAWIVGGEPLHLEACSRNQHRWFRLHGYVWAKSEVHAAKLANEKRAQLIAANEWPEKVT